MTFKAKTATEQRLEYLIEIIDKHIGYEEEIRTEDYESLEKAYSFACSRNLTCIQTIKQELNTWRVEEENT